MKRTFLQLLFSLAKVHKRSVSQVMWPKITIPTSVESSGNAWACRKSKEARSSPLEKQTMQNTDSANENDARLQRASWFLIVSMKCQNKQAQIRMKNVKHMIFSSFLECSYSPNAWLFFILNLNVTSSKWSYPDFLFKESPPLRGLGSSRGVFWPNWQKKSFLKTCLLTLWKWS